jgi:hypothetical protein
MEANSIKLYCSTCSKTDPSAILNCSKRPDNCHYKLKKFKYTGKDGEILSLVFLALGVFFLWFASTFIRDGLHEIPLIRIIYFFLLIPFGGVGLLFSLVGLFLFFGDYLLLFTNGNSASCIIFKIFNITLGYKYFSSQEKLALPAAEINSEFPASIVSVKESPDNPGISGVLQEVKKMIKGDKQEKAEVKERWHTYADSNNGDQVFVAAIISLIAGKFIELKKAKTELYIFKRKVKKYSGKYEYLIYPGENSKEIPAGLLEATLLNKVLNWHNETTGLIAESPLAPTIQTLVKSVYEYNVNSPEFWICEMVRKDAVQNGIFYNDSGTEMYYTKPENLNKIELAKTALEGYKEKLGNSHPEFYQALIKEVEAGLRARENTPD